MQIRDDNRVSVSVDSAEAVSETVSSEAVTEKQKKDYLGIILSGETVKAKDELLDILSTYPGDITVCFKIEGKNYIMDRQVRNCKGLINELLSIVDEDKIKFFKA